MKRKVFININIPNQIKRRLTNSCEKWQELPVKWLKTENLHITLFFLGYIDNDVTIDVCKKIHEVVSNIELFDLEFEKIKLMPNAENPQEFQVVGKSSEKLRILCELIEKKLGIFTTSKKTFYPHITLGKIKKEKWNELKAKVVINEKASFAVSLDSIDIMASHFNKEKDNFILIESCLLCNN